MSWKLLLFPFRWHTRNTDPALLNLHRGTRDMIKLALDAAMPLIENQRENRAQGLVCEFGVGSGKSMRMTQEILPLDIEMHGFDTLYVFCIILLHSSCYTAASMHCTLLTPLFSFHFMVQIISIKTQHRTATGLGLGASRSILYRGGCTVDCGKRLFS